MNGLTRQQMIEMLKNDRYPRSAAYDSQWVLEGWMGPNVLWLAEWLCEKMDLRPGMRVLDMGCGKALSSIFLAVNTACRFGLTTSGYPPLKTGGASVTRAWKTVFFRYTLKRTTCRTRMIFSMPSSAWTLTSIMAPMTAICFTSSGSQDRGTAGYRGTGACEGISR